MRYVFLLILVAGLLLGIGYPFAAQNLSGRELGRYAVYSRDGGFSPVDVELAASDAPLRVMVDMASVGEMELSGARTVLTLTASTEGRTILASTLTFSHQEPRNDNPQTGGQIYRDDAGTIRTIETGTYRFVLGPGDADAIAMRSAEIVLRGDVMPVDARAQPVGYAMMTVGFLGFFLAMRSRSRRRAAVTRTPPPRKWGRG